MPTISYFYGVTIIMYQRGKEHEPPHVHAVTQNVFAPFLISTGEIMVISKFPPKAKAMVKEFILRNQDALMEMWNTGNFKRLDPIE